ncbi:MAG: hypothetical protein J0I70_03795 [Microbacterium sp.]|uniref:hypothetical protein n=1 Tax=Microbacterium sp. TaxID=51671 RepID=UPI001ACD08F6|nr:hypothetical protein [Microbacterium sp.]MBN9152447.1 hypothetical protein [Microbacterium sp.]MBN9173261.1 hypothetical protein [Microbacterium sp.]MBN9185013.1 hypothetical protein [Microbacterium sp.]MBN9188212.1 hypothetical protein [Microbacterium sp.]
MARKDATPAATLAGIPRVNLMPRAELDRRERADAIRRWGWGVVAALAVVVLVAGAGYGLNWAAQQRLADAQGRTTSLVAELGRLSDVSKALKTRTDLESFRAQAMGSDLEWIKTMASLGVVIPDGVVVTGFDLVPGVIPVAGTTPPQQTGLAGTITLESLSPVEIVPVVRAFRKVPGMVSADGVEITSGDDSSDGGGGGGSAGSGGPIVYKYLINVQFDQTLYTNEYAKDGQD